MKRVLIIGSGGAGKSTLAVELGRLLGHDVIHLDALFWRSGWVETPKPEWEALVRELLQRETWIMDGNYGATLDLRLAAADTLVFMDYSRVLCLWRVLKRKVRYTGRVRPDMASGCHERLSWEFLRWIWSYPANSRPRVLEKIRRAEATKRVVILRSPAETRAFLASLRITPC